MSAEPTLEQHRAAIRRKPFLRRLYRDWYARLEAETHAVDGLPGDFLELGSGAGFLSDVLPKVITSDVVTGPGIERQVSAGSLPFPDASLRAIYLVNVLHHVPDAAAFFREAQRTLVLGGRVIMIEQHCSAWGKFVFGKLHYESFDPSAQDWTLTVKGRLDTANGALAHLIFYRDRARFERDHPRLKIHVREHHTPFGYLLSGGVSYPAFMPGWSFPLVRWLDKQFSRATWIFPIFQTIVLERI